MARKKKTGSWAYRFWIGLSMTVVAAATMYVLFVPQEDPRNSPINGEDRIDIIRRKANFVVHSNPAFDGWTLRNATKYMGRVLTTSGLETMKDCPAVVGGKPSNSFDGRRSWGDCFYLPEAQGKCSAGWATVAAAVTDMRACLRSSELGIPPMSRRSAQELLSCDTIDQGCEGGTLDGPYWHWAKNGALSEECFPWRGTEVPCDQMCRNDKAKKVGRPCVIDDQEVTIMREVATHGPVSGLMLLHDDLLNYGGGVYAPSQISTRLTTADRLPVFVPAAIIGWGTEKGTDFWWITTGFGALWGEGGVAKIRRNPSLFALQRFVTLHADVDLPPVPTPPPEVVTKAEVEVEDKKEEGEEEVIDLDVVTE